MINFIKLKSAPIVEKENTLKKQLATNDPVYDDKGNKLGDLEYTISIEDFGDIESQNVSRQSFNNSVIRSNDGNNINEDVDFNANSNTNYNINSSQPPTPNINKNKVQDVKVEESQQKFLKQ